MEESLALLESVKAHADGCLWAVLFAAEYVSQEGVFVGDERGFVF